MADSACRTLERAEKLASGIKNAHAISVNTVVVQHLI